jgi:hypothetical protein
MIQITLTPEQEAILVKESGGDPALATSNVQDAVDGYVEGRERDAIARDALKIARGLRSPIKAVKDATAAAMAAVDAAEVG